MYDINFKDYIEKYQNINNEDWIVLYSRNEIRNYENDIFTFCAMIDKEKVYEDNYMNKFDWGFATNNFGKSGFGTMSWEDNEELFFYDGTSHDDFEYLIALRFFDKYEPSVEINPTLIWYGNLAKHKNGYANSITDEVIIKVSSNKIEIKREYLKDFLCAHGKICVIAFEHKRYFNTTDKLEEKYKIINDDNCYMQLSNHDASGIGTNYDEFSVLIGKVIITPYDNPRHNDYKAYTEEKEF